MITGVIAPTPNVNSTYKNPIAFEDSCDTSLGTCVLDGGTMCVRNVDCGVVDAVDRDPNIKGVRIFVVWDGQDNKANPLKSAGLLPIKFRALSLGKYYNSVEKFALPATN